MVVVTCYNTDTNHRINIHGRNSVNIHIAKLECRGLAGQYSKAMNIKRPLLVCLYI